MYSILCDNFALQKYNMARNNRKSQSNAIITTLTKFYDVSTTFYNIYVIILPREVCHNQKTFVNNFTNVTVFVDEL